MLNYLWSFMILVGMLWGAVNGNLDQVTQGLVDSGELFRPWVDSSWPGFSL